MAKVPFQREIEDLFASDKSAILKMLGGGFVGGALALSAVRKDAQRGGATMSSTVQATVVVGGVVVGSIVVLLLMLRDVVVRRVEQGQRVNPLLRAYFGRGNGCLMLALWFVTLMFATFVVTMLIMNF